VDKELLSCVCEDLKDREEWAIALSGFYQLRRQGIRRKMKPWPHAADLHYPLIDTLVDKFKPYYINQLFVTERLVDMQISDNQQAGLAVEAATWFDYKIKNYSNLEAQIPVLVDYMLLYGHGILQTVWDTDCKCVRFTAISPLFFIIPVDSTMDLQECDRAVFVRHLSPWQYRNGPGADKRNQDEEFIKKITGIVESSAAETAMRNVKGAMEGITHTSRETNLIILWEVYEKTEDGNYMVHTISPNLKNEVVREPFKLPYKNGFYGNKVELPFVNFQFELNDSNYYDARGLAEILFPFQNSMVKMWNEKHDTMTIYNRPMLTSERDYPSVTNIKAQPGQILPGNIRPIVMGAPPISYDQEMANCRLIAEQRAAIPDFGIGGQPFQTQKAVKTATEINTISNMHQVVGEMRGRLFRYAANKTYCQAWGLLKQYDYDLEYMKDNVLKKLPKQAMDLISSIKPNGSSESWNVEVRMRRAVTRLQMFRGDPNVDQGELTRTCLELDEPGIVGRLFNDPQEVKREEAEKQMIEIPPLESGMPIKAEAQDDDEAHLQVLLQYILRNIQIKKRPPDPAGPIMLGQHAQAHLQQLSKKNPAAGRQWTKKWMQLQQALQAQQGGPPQAPQGLPPGGPPPGAPPANLLPPEGAPPPGQPGEAPPEQPPQPPQPQQGQGY
jgi:hypothetical protein